MKKPRLKTSFWKQPPEKQLKHIITIIEHLRIPTYTIIIANLIFNNRLGTIALATILLIYDLTARGYRKHEKEENQQKKTNN